MFEIRIDRDIDLGRTSNHSPNTSTSPATWRLTRLLIARTSPSTFWRQWHGAVGGDGLVKHPAISKASIEDLEATVQMDNHFYTGATLTREQLEDMGFANSSTYNYIGTTRVPCIVFASDEAVTSLLEGVGIGATHDAIVSIIDAFGLMMLFPLEVSGVTNITGMAVIGFNKSEVTMALKIAMYRHA